MNRQFYQLSNYYVNQKGELVYLDIIDGKMIELPINIIINREDGTLPILTYQKQ